jgi:hypothetical protein
MNKTLLDTYLTSKTPMPYSWKDLALSEPLKGESESFDLSKEYSLEESLAHFSKDLSFFYKLELLDEVQKSYAVDVKKYFECFSFHFDLSLYTKITKEKQSWPTEFLQWSKDKDLNPRDCRLFMYSEPETNLNFILKRVSDLKPSKMNGLKIIDLYLDLKAYNMTDESLIKEFKTDKALLKHLQKIKFKEAFKRDEQLDLNFSKINFLNHVKLKVVREGDSNKIELNIRAWGPGDLVKQMESVQKKIKEIESAWSIL